MDRIEFANPRGNVACPLHVGRLVLVLAIGIPLEFVRDREH
jgi:hypothetical protein